MARHARRWTRWLAYGVASLVAVVLLLALALQTSLAREQVRVQVNAALAAMFRGKIHIDRLDGMGLWGVWGVDARILDAQGQQVVRAQGLRARAALPALGWQLLFGGPSASLTIDHVSIDHVDVTLREDEELGVTLAGTFELAAEGEQATQESTEEGSLELYLPAIELRRVWAHGRVIGSPPLDADLLGLRATLRQGAAGFSLELLEAELVTRALPGDSEPRGELWGSIEVPGDDALPLRLEGFLDGYAAGSPLWLEATWVGDDLYANVRLPRIPASYVNQQLSGLSLRGDVALEAEAEGTLPELTLIADARAEAGHVRLHGQLALADELEATVALAAAGVDLAEVVADAPGTELDVLLHALLLTSEGDLRVAHRVELAAGRVAEVDTPALGVQGELELSEHGSLVGSGRFQLNEPGASLAGNYRAKMAGEGSDFVAVSAAGTLQDPPRAAALGVTSAGTIEGEGELWLDSGLVKARLDASLARLDYVPSSSAPPLQARRVELRARLTGSLDDPRAHAATTFDLLSGRAHADLHYSPTQQRAELFVADVDLHRVATLLGTPLPFEQGSLNADLVARRAGQDRPLELNGQLRADFGAAGAVQITATSLELPSRLDTAAPWAGVSGALTAAGKVDLAHANRLSRLVGMPLERATGTLRFELSGRRADDAPPELALLLISNGLRVVERREPRVDAITTTAEAVENAPLALEGIDAHASLRFLPATGEAVATVIARDRGGTLAVVEAEAALGRAWPERLTRPVALLATPLRVHLEVPERRFNTLPTLLRPPGLRGRLALDAELDGSLLEPRARGWVTLQRLRTQRHAEPVDVRSTFRYTTRDGEVFARAWSARGEDLARLDARWQGDALQALRAPAETAGLVASVDTELFGLPLELLPVLAERQLKGRLTGRAELRDWGKDAQLHARFEGRDIKVGLHALPNVVLAAGNPDDRLVAELAVTTGKGTAKATFEADASWGARPVPELKRHGVAKVEAEDFELATFSPLLGAYLSELSGVLDANAQVAVDGDGTRLSGSAKLTKGVVQIPAIGQRFSDIDARVAVGGDKFELRELTARGTTGRLTATGSAGLDGFALRSAELRATIRENEALPITLEGAAIGDAWGNLKVAYASPPAGERRLDIDVPELHLVTPDSGGAALQGLDNAEEIRIGTRRADGTFVVLPVQPLEPSASEPEGDEPAQPLRIRVRLGNDVTVARGATAEVQLTGQLEVLRQREASVTGRIELRGGKLDVQGKTFEIERGVVTFDGKDPANPTITATARWDAPEHTVYAEYVGDVENGHIRLRSEPPLTQDQIASLLLFGDPDGSRGGSDPDTAALAVSVAGETAAKGLNKALSEFTSLDVRARVDTTTGSARPELQLQVSPRVSAKVTRAIGEPAVGESPDRTFLTLELRLKRGWALSALLGDHGASALDLIWRHRY